MKIVCILVGVLFLLFAFWQRNDASQYATADWGVLGWISLYLFTATVSFLAAWKRLPRGFSLTCAILILLNGAYRFSAIQWGRGKILYNEENPAGNESGGLFFTGVWFLVLAAGRATKGPQE